MATRYKSVDAYVKGEVKPTLRPVFAAVREIMRESAPRAKEVLSYNIPMWVGNHHIAFIGSAKNDVKLGFVNGLKLEDKYTLLKGRGKVSRHLVLKSLDDVRKTVLRYYIRQAMKLDAEAKRVRSREK